VAHQLGHGGARIEIAPPLLGVAQRQQDLAGNYAVGGEARGPGAGERDLADGGSGLAFLEPQRPGGQAEHGAAHGDGAGRDHQNLGPGLLQLGNVGAERFEPGGFQAAGAIDQQRRSDLDDNAPVRGNGFAIA
jgi:hypothetical protein